MSRLRRSLGRLRSGMAGRAIRRVHRRIRPLSRVIPKNLNVTSDFADSNVGHESAIARERRGCHLRVGSGGRLSLQVQIRDSRCIPDAEHHHHQPVPSQHGAGCFRLRQARRNRLWRGTEFGPDAAGPPARLSTPVPTRAPGPQLSSSSTVSSAPSAPRSRASARSSLRRSACPGVSFASSFSFNSCWSRSISSSRGLILSW